MSNVISNQLKNSGNFCKLMQWYMSSEYSRLSHRPYAECSEAEMLILHQDIVEATGMNSFCSYSAVARQLTLDEAADRIYHRHTLPTGELLEIYVYPQYNYLMVIYINYHLHVRTRTV